ncbi:MAG: hypothetical protein GQ574_19685 [Crocinitomix sp.]|nr:hypothetical protein [Crocinitomix sp.]
MNNYRNIAVPVKRNGTSQHERLPNTLLPDYVLVDERSSEDLMRFVSEMAKNLKYFNLENQEDGTWADFFPADQSEIDQDSPQYALIRAFLELFKLSQDNLNNFTKRHLDFYYEDVLRFNKEKAKPNQVHLIMELAKNVQTHFLKEGALFKAGKAIDGKDMLYKLMHDTELSQAEITDRKTVFLQKKTLEVGSIKTVNGQDVETFRQLDYVQGIFAAAHQGKDTISALGNDSLPIGDIGFAIAAPVLLMREGERSIRIIAKGVFNGDDYWLNHLPNDFPKLDADENSPENELIPPFILKFSGKNEWIEALPHTATIRRDEDEQSNLIVNIEVKLGKTIEPIVPYENKNLGGQFKTEWPMVQILLNPAGVYPYSILKDLDLQTTEVIVAVQDLKTLILQNDFAKLNSNKPFQPFGQQAAVGANFYIGSGEVFQKELESVKLHLNWYDLPGNDLSEHYVNYTNATRNNADFKVDLGILKNKNWIDLNQPSALFEPDANSQKTIELIHGNIESDEAPDFKELEPYGIDSVRGFIKLTLQSPDFGHKAYPNLYTKAITALNSDVELPNQPYTPTLQSISLDYTARTEIDVIDDQNHLFHIHPFGWSPHTVLNDTPYLFPNYEGEGNLYIGIENLQPPCELSILFQIIEGSANPNSHKPEINWTYLANDEWFPLEGPAILRDGTDQFNSSGIITFSIPAQINMQNQTLEKGKYWLRASAATSSNGTCLLSDLQAQGATLVEVIDMQSTQLNNEPLAPNSIQKMLVKDMAIKSIKQPYVSIHGKGAETDHAFYRRISERLRHKQRALTTWDYERLALGQFPGLYKAKCYNHASWEKGNVAGHVLVIIIPDLRNNPEVNQLKPLASLGLQEQVKTFLQNLAPPHVQIEVRNPIFETIQTQFLVKFKAGFNNGFYENQLQAELKAFLSPWAYSEGKEINLGGRIYKSSLLNFAEERPYVDYVTFFKMSHMDADGNVRINVEEAEAISPISILTSASSHKITVIDDEAAMCADGIGHMIIEETFITIK